MGSHSSKTRTETNVSSPYSSPVRQESLTVSTSVPSESTRSHSVSTSLSSIKTKSSTRNRTPSISQVLPCVGDSRLLNHWFHAIVSSMSFKTIYECTSPHLIDIRKLETEEDRDIAFNGITLRLHLKTIQIHMTLEYYKRKTNRSSKTTPIDITFICDPSSDSSPKKGNQQTQHLFHCIRNCNNIIQRKWMDRILSDPKRAFTLTDIQYLSIQSCVSQISLQLCFELVMPSQQELLHGYYMGTNNTHLFPRTPNDLVWLNSKTKKEYINEGFSISMKPENSNDDPNKNLSLFTTHVDRTGCLKHDPLYSKKSRRPSSYRTDDINMDKAWSFYFNIFPVDTQHSGEISKQNERRNRIDSIFRGALLGFSWEIESDIKSDIERYNREMEEMEQHMD